MISKTNKTGEGLSSAFPGLLSVIRGKNLYVGNCDFLYANKLCIINRGIVSTPQYQSLIHKSAKEAGTNASDRSLRGRTGGQG